MVQMEIYEEFEKWLNDLLEQNTIPDDAKAFNFNLYEESEEDSIYAVQLIAADRFDENDPDWACDEVWSSEEDIFCVDTSDEDDTGWKKAMELISGLVSEYLENGLHRNILLNTEAVGIGFVDGDIEILRRAE
ncbi:MAG: hypothetical protein GXY08_01215 [Ruminococcus sp.]|nr:hypothetical protein [Ruminococcus sp.]